jgi:hypothetical protein
LTASSSSLLQDPALTLLGVDSAVVISYSFASFAPGAYVAALRAPPHDAKRAVQRPLRLSGLEDGLEEEGVEDGRSDGRRRLASRASDGEPMIGTCTPLSVAAAASPTRTRRRQVAAVLAPPRPREQKRRW